MKVSVTLYKSKTLSNGEHPIMIRVSSNGKKSYKSIGISCKTALWDSRSNRPKKNHPNKDLIDTIISKKLAEYDKVKLEYLNEGKDFTSDSIIQKVESPIKKTTVLTFYNVVIDRMEAEGKIGNANNYKDAKRSVKNFLGDRDITFSELDFSFLTSYKTYLRKKKLRDTTVSVYMRNIRALFNKAINEGYAKKEHYPFDRFKITDLNIETRKRAIEKTDMKKIESLALDSSSTLNDSRNWFMFMYYGRGINFTDLAKLKWGDIEGDRVYYTRSKTGKLLEFPLIPNSKEIIEFYRPLTFKGNNSYVFPILNKDKHITNKQVDNRIHKLTTRTNKDLKEIGKLAGIKTPLTTYVARHTFANVLKNSEVSISKISESLGHKTEKITRTYLKSFKNDELDETMNHLT